MKDKIKKYRYDDIIEIELKEIEIIEKTKILFNESNKTEFTHTFNTIQFLLVINGLHNIKYYNDEKIQAIKDYNDLLKLHKNYIKIFKEA